MIIIDYKNRNNTARLICDDKICYGFIRNDEEFTDYCKEFYDIPKILNDIIKPYPNIIISGLLMGESDKLFKKEVVVYELHSLQELSALLDKYSEDYIVIHTVTVKTDDLSYLDYDSVYNEEIIEVCLYHLETTSNLGLNSFLRKETINKILETL